MRLLLVFFLWQISFISFAKEVSYDYANATELKMLPKFCQDRFKYGGNSIEFSKWKGMLGQEALHVHHYCAGLVSLNRAATRDKYRKSRLSSARADFNYTLRTVQHPKFILLPDLYYRLAIVSKEEGNPSEAVSFATKSIQAKKNYLNPYIFLADIYIKSGNKSEAKKILLQAQQYHPNSKKLKKRLKKIK